MFCPQCGAESPPEQRFCRVCGANLKVIGQAVSLSEAIARTDRGPLTKLKDLMESAKVKQVTDDVSRALEQIGKQISGPAAPEKSSGALSWWQRRELTAAERREKHLVNGTVTMFTGIGLMVFLYYLSGALVLKLPPDALAKIPFELAPVIRIIWLVGLMPTLSGLGRIIAGLSIHVPPENALPPAEPQALPPVSSIPAEPIPASRSVIEHTTELLGQKMPLPRR
jgi:hypothetical protein